MPLPPEYEELLRGLLQSQGQQGFAQEDEAYGRQQASMPGPQGRQVGGLFIASSPFEAIASGLTRYQGLKQAKEARARREAAMAQRAGLVPQFAGPMMGQDPTQARAAGVAGMLSGDPALAGAGRYAAGAADTRESVLRKAMEAMAARRMGREEKLSDIESQRTYQEERDRRQNAEAMRRAQVMAGQRADALAATKEKGAQARTDKAFIGPEFEPTPEAGPLPDSVRSGLLNQSAAGRQIISQSGEMLDLLRRNGGGKIFGDDATRMSQLATSIQLKEKELQKLGVLNGKDFEILQRIVKNPTEVATIAADKAGARSLRKIYEGVVDLTRSDVIHAVGPAYKVKKGSVFESRTVKVRDPQDGKVKVIPRKFLDEALKDGAIEVE